MAKESAYQIHLPIKPQGEEKRYQSINNPLFTYYVVPDIALPSSDGDESWYVISDCSIPELCDSWKTLLMLSKYLSHVPRGAELNLR